MVMKFTSPRGINYMKKTFLLIILFLPLATFAVVRKWTNGSGNGLWGTSTNWSPAGVPVSTDDVVFDNTFVVTSYFVDLPLSATTLNTLTIAPTSGLSIRIKLPSGNTSLNGISLSSASGDDLIIKSGGIFENLSGAASFPAIAITTLVRIENGGRYIHNTSISAQDVVNYLSYAGGTELGVIEYAQGTSSSILASGIVYNSVELSTTTTKTFSIAGSSPTTFRGFLMIDNNVTLNSSKNGSIFFGGDLIMNGNFTFSPSSSGSVDRSLEFNGANQFISGAGTFTTGNNFRNFKIDKGATVTLQKDITITTPSGTQDSIIVDSSATLKFGIYYVGGVSNFKNYYGSTISLGSPFGISNLGSTLGNIRTTNSRKFDTSGHYEYTGTSDQVTGSGLPSSVRNLILNKTDISSLFLTNSVNINDSLSLQGGFLVTTLSVLPKLRDTTVIVSPASIYITQLGSNIGYQKSFIAGPVIRTITSKTAKWFPVGKLGVSDTLFAPVRLAKFNGNAVNDTVEYFFARHFDTTYSSPPLHHISKLEYWNIRGNVIGVDNTDTLLLTWRPQSRVGTGRSADSTAAFNDLAITHYFDDDGPLPDPIKWYIDGEPTTFVKVGTLSYGSILSVIPVAATSSFTLGTRSGYNLLPVRLISFYGYATPVADHLYWTVENDVDVSRYIMERSNNGIAFTESGSVVSKQRAGTTAYEFTNASASYGWNYYRLKIIDGKGNNYYSAVIRIWHSGKSIVSIYPNPAGNYIQINGDVEGSVSTIEIVNTRGQVVLTKEFTQAHDKINIEELSKGMYIVRFRNHNQLFNERFIKQ